MIFRQVSVQLAIAVTLCGAGMTGIARAESGSALETVPASYTQTTYDRYEQVSCGSRVVTYHIPLEINAVLPVKAVSQVAEILVSFPELGKEGAPLDFNFEVVREYAPADGRPAILYPPGLFNEARHVESYEPACSSEYCRFAIPFYAEQMLPPGGAGKRTSMVLVTRDADGEVLRDETLSIELPLGGGEVYNNSRFEDFSVILGDGHAAIYPLPGFRDRVLLYKVHIADADGWREISLIREPLREGNFWFVPWKGELEYFGVLTGDLSGRWENKSELVDLQRKSGISPYGGSCRRY
jgi:hypothetical protein